MEKFKLEDSETHVLMEKIKFFFQRELDLDIGDLKAYMILDFFLDKLAKDIYNMAIEDCYKHLEDRLEDLYSLKIYK